MTTKFLKYVPHDRVPEHLDDGWRVVDSFAGSHHGEYSVLMEISELPEGDPLGPVKGLINGLFLAGILWAVILIALGYIFRW